MEASSGGGASLEELKGIGDDTHSFVLNISPFFEWPEKALGFFQVDNTSEL